MGALHPDRRRLVRTAEVALGCLPSRRIGSEPSRQGMDTDEGVRHCLHEEPAVVDVVSGALDDCGPRLLVCRSSLDVLGTAQAVDADLLILDLETPGLNGLLLISAIKNSRRHYPSWSFRRGPTGKRGPFPARGCRMCRWPLVPTAGRLSRPRSLASAQPGRSSPSKPGVDEGKAAA